MDVRLRPPGRAPGSEDRCFFRSGQTRHSTEILMLLTLSCLICIYFNSWFVRLFTGFADAHIPFLQRLRESKYHNVWHGESNHFHLVIRRGIERENWEKCPERAGEGEGAFCVGGSHGDTWWQEQNRTKKNKKKKERKKERKKKRQRKIISESSVRIKSICHHILLTLCNRCSLNVMRSATDTPQSKQITTAAQPHG